jgi:hypothetical protein
MVTGAEIVDRIFSSSPAAPPVPGAPLDQPGPAVS